MSAIVILVEAHDRHGRALVRERVRLDESQRRFTVGRSVAADVTLDDIHAAPLHAAIDVLEDGRLAVTDLGSLNGILIGGHRHRGARDLEFAGDTLQVGATRLRIRTTRDVLAPEVPDGTPLDALVRHPGWLAGAAALLASGDMIYESWLGAPQQLTDTIVTALAIMAAFTIAWVSVWSLLSRVMLGEWRWLTHAAIMLGTGIVYSVAEGLIDLGRFALALPTWTHKTAWLVGLTLAGGLYLQLTHASNLSRRRAAVAAVLVPMLIVGGGTWFYARSEARDVNHIVSTSRLYPPALRVTAADQLDSVFADMPAWRAAADAKRRKAMADDPDGTGDD